MKKLFGLAVAAVLCLATSARSAPLDPQQMPADAKWGVHLDVDALHASTVFQKARKEFLKNHPEAESHLAKLRETWKFDPAADLHGITIYGTQVKKDTGVAIIHAKVDESLLLEKVKQAPDHQTAKHGKYELHTWTHAKGSKHNRSMTGTFYSSDVLVFGASVDEVKAALDVLDGAKPNVLGKVSELNFSLPPGAILVAGAIGLTDADLPTKSPIAKKINSLVLAAGEDQEAIFVVAQAAAKQTQTAQQIKAVLDGALAMAALAHSDDAEAMKLIGAVKAELSDKTVSVEWKAPVEAVLALMQKASDNWEKHKDQRPFGLLFHPDDK
jgi:hypothetical protein